MLIFTLRNLKKKKMNEFAFDFLERKDYNFIVLFWDIDHLMFYWLNKKNGECCHDCLIFIMKLCFKWLYTALNFTSCGKRLLHVDRLMAQGNNKVLFRSLLLWAAAEKSVLQCVPKSDRMTLDCTQFFGVLFFSSFFSPLYLHTWWTRQTILQTTLYIHLC